MTKGVVLVVLLSQDLWQPSGIFMTGLEPVAALSEHSEGLLRGKLKLRDSRA